MKQTAFFTYLTLFFFVCASLFAGQFTVTIDAGHGGKDSGATGSRSQEKNINLSVALKLGKLIEKNYPDVKVIYTRKTDVFIPLEERAEIANRAKSNLFICIHTNWVPYSSAVGAETYTLGLAKTEANMDVAQRENNVILLESDYKEKYQGFDPNSTDSYIMFEYLQNKNIDRSIEFAADVQNQLSQKVNRTDRGVRQAGFWVLHRTAMPAVLVELGYISNRSEEKFLISSEGQQQIAEAILSAFDKFRHDYQRRKAGANHPDSAAGNVASADAGMNRDTAASTDAGAPASSSPNRTVSENVQPAQNNSADTLPVFKVQFYASSTKLKANDALFQGMDQVNVYREGSIYKYTSGASTDYQSIVNYLNKVVKTFPDAFVVVFAGGKKITVQQALDRSQQVKK